MERRQQRTQQIKPGGLADGGESERCGIQIHAEAVIEARRLFREASMTAPGRPHAGKACVPLRLS